MSKQNKAKKYRLDSVKPAYEEALGTDVVEIEGTDGKTYSFPHPLFMDDEQEELVGEASTKYELAEALLGDSYEDFVAGGNSLSDLALLFGAIQREMQEKAQKVRITRR